MKKVIFALLIISTLAFAECRTERIYTLGEPGGTPWTVQWDSAGIWVPTADDFAAKEVLRPTVYDLIVGSPYPWGKLYSFPGVEWVSMTNSARESVNVPPQYYRYTGHLQFVIDDTVSRATIWCAADDYLVWAELIDRDAGVVIPLLSVYCEGFEKITRIDVTDDFRSLTPGHAYDIRIYVKDTRKSYTALFFYLSWDEDDDDQLYTYTVIDTGWHLLSMPFHGPSGVPFTALFPTADSVLFHDPYYLGTFKVRASLVQFDGLYGDLLRTFTTGVHFTAAAVCTVRGSSIWEQRYIGIDKNDTLFFGTPDCSLSWVGPDNTPDDYPDRKILKSRTYYNQPCLGSPLTNPDWIVPQYWYYTIPVPGAATLPYSLDLIVPPCCVGGLSAGMPTSSARRSNSDYTPPPSPGFYERIRTCCTGGPDTSDIMEYLDSLRVWELIDYGASSSPRSAPKISTVSGGSLVLQTHTIPSGVEISLILPKGDNVAMSVYSLDGKLVKQLCNSYLGEGKHKFVWDGISESGAEMPSGVFLIRIDYGGRSFSKKFMIVR